MKSKSSRKVRYAVVGLGHLAQVAVLPAFKSAKNSQLVALVSEDAEKRKKLGRKYGIDRVFSYEEYAVRAAKMGVHVLCEKPMAVTVEDCQAMIDAAEENGVKLMIAYRLHF